MAGTASTAARPSLVARTQSTHPLPPQCEHPSAVCVRTLVSKWVANRTHPTATTPPPPPEQQRREPSWPCVFLDWAHFDLLLVFVALPLFAAIVALPARACLLWFLPLAFLLLTTPHRCGQF